MIYTAKSWTRPCTKAATWILLKEIKIGPGPPRQKKRKEKGSLKGPQRMLDLKRISGGVVLPCLFD